MYCKKCGAQIPDGNRYCSVCGTSVADDISSNQVNPIMSGQENVKSSNRVSVISIVIIFVIIFTIAGIVMGAIFGIRKSFDTKLIVEEEKEEILDVDEDELLATFKGGYLTKEEYLVYYEMFNSYLKTYGHDEADIPMEILEKAVQDKLIKTLAQEAGITLSKAAKNEVEDIFNNNEYMDYFSNNYTFDLDQLKEIYYSDYIIEAYIEELEEQLTDQEVLDYIKEEYPEITDYNGYETQHILLTTQKDDGSEMTQTQKEEVYGTAKGLLSRIKNGEKFADLAKGYSDDQGTAEDGGKYTMYMNGSTVKEYEDAVKTLSEGQLYDGIVETQYGYHIIKLNKIVPNGIVQSEEYREEIVNNGFDDILDNKEYKVKIYEDRLNDFVNEIKK